MIEANGANSARIAETNWLFSAGERCWRENGSTFMRGRGPSRMSAPAAFRSS
jgi:hypothetical protein